MAVAAVPRWWALPPAARSSEAATARAFRAPRSTAVLCAHVHPILRREHSNGRIRSTADSGTGSMPASRQAPFIHVHNFHPPDYASVTGIGNWVTAVTWRGKCRALVPSGSHGTQRDGALERPASQRALQDAPQRSAFATHRQSQVTTLFPRRSSHEGCTSERSP
jgi:hypothetical protein